MEKTILGAKGDKFSKNRLKKIKFEKTISDALKTIQKKNHLVNKIPKRSSTFKILLKDRPASYIVIHSVRYLYSSKHLLQKMSVRR